MRKKHPITPPLIAAGLLALIGVAHTDAAFTDFTLNQAAGPVTWESAANWTTSGSGYPDTGSGGGGTNGDKTLVVDATGNRTLTTNGNLNIGGLIITQSSNAVSKLVLGGNISDMSNNASSVTNTSGSAANVVIDVKTFTLNLNSDGTLGGTQPGGGGLTIRADPGGLVTSRRFSFTNDTTVIGPNVTLRTLLSANTILRGSFDATTAVQFYGATDSLFFVDTNTGTFATSPGQVVVGNGVSAASLVMNLQASSKPLQVRGDMIISNNATLSFTSTNNFIPNKIRVGGNFIDTNTTGTYTLATTGGGSENQIIFNGSPSTARTVDLRRSVPVHFAVGVSAADKGNVRLVHDLITTGTFLVRTGSALDVDTYTLTTGAFTLNDSGILGYRIGTDPGLIAATSLTLDDFTLRITNLPNNGWQNGNDLILFTYTGLTNLMGLTAPTIVVSDGWLRYDAFVTSGGSVRLTNVFIPEPGTALLVLIGLLGFTRRDWSPSGGK